MNKNIYVSKCKFLKRKIIFFMYNNVILITFHFCFWLLVRPRFFSIGNNSSFVTFQIFFKNLVPPTDDAILISKVIEIVIKSPRFALQ